MRFIHFYLIAYFALIAGATIALWQSGVLVRISAPWLVLTAAIVVGLGLALALTSMKSTHV